MTVFVLSQSTMFQECATAGSKTHHADEILHRPDALDVPAAYTGRLNVSG
jgi:hypothetical protein